MEKMYNVKRIEKNYPALTLERKENNPCEYELGLISAYTSELERGFKVNLNIGATKEGTRIEFIAVESQEEINDCEKAILDMAKEFERKYEGWDIMSCLKK